MSDKIILNKVQRRKLILGKAFNIQHDLFDLIFLDSYNNNFNNFINLYERGTGMGSSTVIMEVDSNRTEEVYLQWNHGDKGEDGISKGMRYPGFVTYMKTPTKEDEPHKIVDVDMKNLEKIVDAESMEQLRRAVEAIEVTNLSARLLPKSFVPEMHDLIDRIGGIVKDEFSRYSWVGGVFWGGKGFSYWGDWNSELMRDLAEAGLVDELTNVGDDGYHAQRLCSPQILKPTMVTNYMCGGSYDSFKYCCPAFFMLKGTELLRKLEEYHKMNFITTYRSQVPFETILKWQDRGDKDLRLWEGWRKELKRMEDDIRTLVFMTEK